MEVEEKNKKQKIYRESHTHTGNINDNEASDWFVLDLYGMFVGWQNAKLINIRVHINTHIQMQTCSNM